jgi:uncharacterized protein YigE (DUF2233 family)
MKRFLSLWLIVFVGLIVWFYLDQKQLLTSSSPLPLTSTKTLTEPSAQKVNFQGQSYRFTYFFVHKAQDIKTISNLSNRQDTTEIIKNNRCQKAINGGFYTENFQPLGLLIIDNQPINANIDSQLINSYLTLAPILSISSERLMNETTVIQTGPLLINQGETVKLNLVTDKFSRRMVAAINDQDQLLFLAVFNDDAVFSGPKLADLPLILEIIFQQQKFKIIQATNLDGGSASMFKNQDLYLSEYKTVGEVICVK